MILYGARLSPFVRKVLVVAAEKGIDLELRPAGPGAPPSDEFLQASPFAKIPALRDGDFTLADSSAITWYLETLHPEPNLIPIEARARARVVWFDEFADTIASPPKLKVFWHRVVAPLIGRESDAAAAEKAEREEVPGVVDYLERIAPEPGGYLVEDRFTLADIAVASPFVNLMHARSPFDEARHPRAAAYVRSVLARPSFAALVERERKFLAR